MYGLKQAGKISYDDTKQRILPHGHALTKHTPGLWYHANSKLRFNRIADDFGIKHTNISQLQPRLHAQQQKYEIVVDWTGTLFSGISLY